MDSIIPALNVSHTPLLLIFAWNTLKLAFATNVKILSVNENEISFSIVSNRLFDKEISTNSSYTFSSEDKREYPDLEKRVVHILQKDTSPIFPPSGIHSINLWLIGIIAAIPKTYYSGPLLFLKTLFMYLFQDDIYAMYFLFLMSSIHVCEVLYIAYLISPVVKRSSSLSLWLLQGFLLGYPVTEKAMQISEAYTISQKAKKSK